MNIYDSVSDDDLAEFINKVKEDEAEKSAKSSGGSSSSFTYEEVKWCPLSLNKDKKSAIVRLVGRPPLEGSTQRSPTDSKELCCTKIKDDNDKQLLLNLPLRQDIPDDNHIMWKIIDKVLEPAWTADHKRYDKNAGVNNELPNANLVEMIRKGGYSEQKDGHWPYVYAQGWNAKRTFFVNVIDRRDTWCKDQKHTKVLSKGVSTKEYTDENGTKTAEFADRGVPSNGFLNVITTDFLANYGSWEKYDLVISRTGQKTSPNKIQYGSLVLPAAKEAHLDKVLNLSDDEEKLISTTPLTDEERSYERYDLDKLFHVTPYNTILKRLGNSIKKIDAGLKTSYYDELTKLAANEKATWEKERAEKIETDKTVKPIEVTATKSEPAAEPAKPTAVREATSTRVSPNTKLTPEKISLLKGWDSISDEEKTWIEDVIVNPDGTFKDVVWNSTLTDGKAFAKCDDPNCSFVEPTDLLCCVHCGKKF